MEELFKNIKLKLLSAGLSLEVFNYILKICDNYVSDNYKKFDLEKIDCKKGCGYCCKVNVSVLEIEAKNIGHFLLTNIEDVSAIKERLKKTSLRIKSFDDEERIAARIDCPFLNKEGECIIYPVRPILCRSVTSVDHNQCIEALNAVYFGEQVFITSNLYVKSLYEELFMMICEFSGNEKSREISHAVYEYINGDL